MHKSAGNPSMYGNRSFSAFRVFSVDIPFKFLRLFLTFWLLFNKITFLPLQGVDKCGLKTGRTEPSLS
jgi:hypothetical protein